MPKQTRKNAVSRNRNLTLVVLDLFFSPQSFDLVSKVEADWNPVSKTCVRQISELNLEADYSSGVPLTSAALFSQVFTSGPGKLEGMKSDDPPWRHCLQHRPPMFLPPLRLQGTSVCDRHTTCSHVRGQCDWQPIKFQLLLGLGACAPAGWTLLVTPGCLPGRSLPTWPGDWAEREARVSDCDRSIYLCSQLAS